jgi:hypothetical protein
MNNKQFKVLTGFSSSAFETLQNNENKPLWLLFNAIFAFDLAILSKNAGVRRHGDVWLGIEVNKQFCN